MIFVTHPWEFGWDALVALGTLALAGVTVVVALQARRGVAAAREAAHDARAAAQLPAVMELHRTYQSEEFRRCRRIIVEALPPCDPARGLNQLDARDRDAVETISNFLDSLGVLVAYELLNPEPAAAFLGGSTLNMWRRLGPFIEAERRTRVEKTYQRHFEHVAAVFLSMNYRARIDELRKLPVIELADADNALLSENVELDD